jgi:hypothetical protein
MQANNSRSWANSKKYGENNVKDAYQLNPYPITNHKNYKS